MQTVPSLVGTGTVVAAATTGLVFGQPAESPTPTPTTPSSPFRRKLFSDVNCDSPRGTPTPSLELRPGTSPALYSAQPVEECPNRSPDEPHPSPLASHPVNVTNRPPTVGSQTTPPKSRIRGAHSFTHRLYRSPNAPEQIGKTVREQREYLCEARYSASAYTTTTGDKSPTVRYRTSTTLLTDYTSGAGHCLARPVVTAARFDSRADECSLEEAGLF
ncbi:hypothetical protein VSDG_09307 [Cytospora chrysosperma]|uniref:Uncharacterized protein n=1 Tax=Cytospora chrysosperma TaxID=252740 RepID=A0A423VC77_CYTCH|nr:hypothetical protein VSDG_09307 [Valsa sordida]